MSKKPVYVRESDNVCRKEKSISDVENMLNELMECGFQVDHSGPDPSQKGKPRTEKRWNKCPSSIQTPPAHVPAYRPPVLHPYTTAWRDQLPPFFLGMLATCLLQKGLPSIKYYLGALAAFVKWTATAGTILGAVLLYAGLLPDPGRLQELFEETPLRRVLEFLRWLLGPVALETNATDPEPSEIDFRPEVPAKTTPETKLGPPSVTNVRAFQAQLRQSSKSPTGSSKSEGEPPSARFLLESRTRMRRAFTDGAPADDESVIGRRTGRRQSDHGRGLGTNRILPSELAERPRVSPLGTHRKHLSDTSSSDRLSAPYERHSTTPLTYDSPHASVPADDLPFSFEMKMKDSDQFSLQRLDTTTTKQSVLGTRANYSKFLANVHH